MGNRLSPALLCPVGPLSGRWAPASLGTNKLIQSLPTLTYESSTYGGRNVLSDLARTGTKREPRQQRVYLFDGTNDYATLGVRLTTGAASVFVCSCWIKSSSAAGITIANEYLSTGNQRGWAFQVTSGGKLSLIISGDGSTNTGTVTSTDSVNDNTWKHVAFVYSASTVTLYINGAVAASGLTGSIPAAMFNTSAAFIFGGLGPGTSSVFAGCMKDLRVYSVAKSAAEIASYNNQGANPTTFDQVGLLAHYACEEESGAIAYDSSGNGKHLTITNASTLPGGTFHATDSTLPHSMANEYGGSYGAVALCTVSSSWNNGWVSGNSFVGDGYIDFIQGGANALHNYGITDTPTLPTTNGIVGIARAIDFTSPNIRRFLSGSLEASTAGTLAAGDRVTFRRTGTTITVEKNGVLLTTFTSTAIANATPLYAAIGSYTSTEATACVSVNGSAPTTGWAQNFSISTRVIPRSLSTPANDVLGNTAHYTGQVPHYATVEPPCITGDGTAVQANFGTFSLTGDFTVSFYEKVSTHNPVKGEMFIGGGTPYASGASYQGYFWRMQDDKINWSIDGEVQVFTPVAYSAWADTAWHKIVLTRVGTTYTVTIDGIVAVTATGPSGTWTLRSCLNTYSSYYLTGSMCDLQITHGGVTKTFPLQEGPGDAGTNRTLYGYASDGSAVTAGTLVNGTVSTIWANRCPYAKDYAVANGSRVSSGVTIPANPATGLAAEGSALNRAAGYPTIDSTRLDRLNWNPFTAAGLNPYAAETAAFPEDDRQLIAPVDTKFRRVDTTNSRTDRHFIAGNITGYTATGLTGSDLTNANAYVGAYSSTPTADYSFPLQGTIVPDLGAYTITSTRACTAYVKDHEGLLKLAKSGEVRFNRMRRVENLISTPDFTNGAWVATTTSVGSSVSDPLSGTTAYTLTSTTGGGYIYAQASAAAVSVDQRCSLWMRRRTGTGSITIQVAATSPVDITATMTTSWQRVTIPVQAGTVRRLLIQLMTTGDAVDVWRPQLEEVTGQAITAPSEYVSVGVLSSPFHGAGVDGVKYYATANGNTVSTNVVTEATGAALTDSTSDPLAVLLEPAATNLHFESSISSNVGAYSTAGHGTLTANAATCPLGTSVAASYVGSAAATQHEFYWTPGVNVTAGTVYTYSVFAKANGYTNFQVDGDNLGTHFATFQLSGAGSVLNTTGCTAYIEAWGNGWYRCAVTFTATATVNVNPFIYTTANGTTRSHTPNGTSGYYFFGNHFAAESAPSSYIPTTTASATRLTDNPSLSTAVINDTQGWVSMEVQSLYHSATALQYIGKAVMYLDGGSTSVGNYDNTNDLFINTVTLSTKKTVCSTWGGGTKRIACTGKTAASGNYDGGWNIATSWSFGVGATGTQVPVLIRNLKIGTRRLSDRQQNLIVGN
jgi:hypothetical protein